MPCYKPLEAWRSLELTSSGKNKIVFKKPATSLVAINLPCGQCIGCKLDRSLMWAIRSVNEAQLHTQNCFITLTYAEEHLPWDGSLVISHFQKFIRRLRKSYPTVTIRYFMCGEYGEKFKRPHYHACLFGIDFPDKEIWKETEGILTYTSESLEKEWQKGFCTLGELNFETAAYTARYITKKINGNMAEQHYQTTCPYTGNTINLHPEYTCMSRRPGIASDWYKKYKTDIYPSDFLIHGNKKVKVPRYYDNLYDIDTDDLEVIKIQRKENARKFRKDNTPERLAVREKIKQLNYKQLTRSYEQA